MSLPHTVGIRVGMRGQEDRLDRIVGKETKTTKRISKKDICFYCNNSKCIEFNYLRYIFN